MTKTVFITGAGKRLGAFFAEHFAEKGWNVAIHFHSSKEKAELLSQKITEQYGVRTILVCADLRVPDQIFSAFHRAANALGKFDVLVNNAGIFPEKKSASELSMADWDETLSVNTRAALLCTQEFLKYRAETASIVNIASLGGLKIWHERIAYNVSKSALIQLTKALARDLAPRVSVNCVAPGMIHVPDDNSAGEIRLSLDKIPAGRYGSPQDVFDAVWFFATANSFITGQILSVDGGQHLL